VTDIFNGGDTGMNGTPGQLSNSLQVGPTELDCAGALGCHGRHDSLSNSSDAGIKGFHHGSVGQSGYRFLWIGNSANNGTPVLGKGAADWEEGGAASSNHNVYSADLIAGISRYCAYCHGEFHDAEGEVGTGTALDPFVRHPTDRALGTGGANWSWGNFNWQTTAYNQTPLAFTDFISVNYTNVNTNTVYFGNTDYGTTGAVMCLSCHRAHGSQYEDILRWEYDMVAGTNSTAGCLACHYLQRGTTPP
jgi:hypothetical protein